MLDLLRKLLRNSLDRWAAPLRPLATSEDVTEYFFELFRGHGLPCKMSNGWVVADSGCLSSQTAISIHSQRPNFVSVQLDVCVRTGDGLEIVDSCGGIGTTLHQAIGNAVNCFCQGSFHVIFSALSHIPCSHCDIEDWEIRGLQRRVFSGPTVVRGNIPKAKPPLVVEWFRHMEKFIRQYPLPSGMHWIRLYHAEPPGQESISEALLDNEINPELQNHAAAFPWPPSKGFYSLRLFLIISDAAGLAAKTESLMATLPPLPPAPGFRSG